MSPLPGKRNTQKQRKKKKRRRKKREAPPGEVENRKMKPSRLEAGLLAHRKVIETERQVLESGTQHAKLTRQRVRNGGADVINRLS